MLGCAVVFGWVGLQESLEAAYSWGVALIILILIVMENGLYMRQARIHARKNDKVGPYYMKSEQEGSPIK